MRAHARKLVAAALALILLGVAGWVLSERRSSTAASFGSAPASDFDGFLDSLRAEEGELGSDEVGIEDPSGHALDAFHEALRGVERGEGVARIAVYGGSHTAGDLYTGRMRQILQGRFGDSGHGFVPLVPVVNNAWAWGIVIDAAEGFEAMQVAFKRREVFRYGLAGVAFLADEPEARAAVWSDHWGNGRFASRIDLLYDELPGGGSFEVCIDGQRTETIDTAADPPRVGLRTYRVSDATHSTEVRTVGDGPVTVYGVMFERDRPGVIVDNLGLVGSKARHQLLWDEEQWATYFTRLDPDLVVFAYGNNETTDPHLDVAGHERRLNAVVCERFEDAEREAMEADRRILEEDPDTLPPFLGVPCTIKESFQLTGMPQTSGLVARRDHVSTSDAPIRDAPPGRSLPRLGPPGRGSADQTPQLSCEG